MSQLFPFKTSTPARSAGKKMLPSSEAEQARMACSQL